MKARRAQCAPSSSATASTPTPPRESCHIRMCYTRSAQCSPPMRERTLQPAMLATAQPAMRERTMQHTMRERTLMLVSIEPDSSPRLANSSDSTLDLWPLRARVTVQGWVGGGVPVCKGVHHTRAQTWHSA